MNRATVLAAAVVLAIGLSACRDGTTSPTVTPLDPSGTSQPSTSAPPSSRASSSSASPTASATPDQAALVKEAEVVYRKLQAEAVKLEERGGADELPPAFRQYAMDPYLSQIRQAYRNLKEVGSKSTDTDRLHMTFTAADYRKQIEAITALNICLDGSKISVHRRDGTVVPGTITMRTAYFKRDVDGKLKAFAGTTKRVEKC